jgi:16S rRNA G966 N2-methylase RsmD
MAKPSGNVLYYGDNLDVLRRHVPDESVDLVYLDPPFSSNATYNVLFGHADGSQALRRAGIQALARSAAACSAVCRLGRGHP